MKQEIIKQETKRFATREVSATFVRVGDTVWDDEECVWAKLQEGGVNSDLAFVRILSSEFGLEFNRSIWSDGSISWETSYKDTETHFISVNGKEIEVADYHYTWFDKHIKEELLEADIEVEMRIETTKVKKVPDVPNTLSHPKWVVIPEVLTNLPDGVTVKLNHISLYYGTMSVTAKAENEDQNGVALTSDEVDEALKYLFDMVINTLKGFECWDDEKFVKDCKSELKATSVRTCDTAFLG